MARENTMASRVEQRESTVKMKAVPNQQNISGARPSRQRKLVSVRTAQNQQGISISDRSLNKAWMASVPQVSVLDDALLPNPFQLSSRSSSLCQAPSRTTSGERVVFDEKIDSRKRLLRPFSKKESFSPIHSDEDISLVPHENADETEDSLSDFIVDDSASEEELRRPPRSMRKVERSVSRVPRKSKRIISDDEDEDEEDIISPSKLLSKNLSVTLKDSSLEASKNQHEPPGISIKHQIKDEIDECQSTRQLDEALKDLTLHTPPTSPSKPRLKSPTKSRIVIPGSPHRLSTDAYWLPDMVNDFNEQYSPQKTLKIKKFFNAEDENVELSPSISPTRKASRSPVKRDKATIARKKAFDESKHGLASRFFEELDRNITNGQLGKLSKTTGGVKIVWSKTLNSTAGRAKWQREAIRTTDSVSNSSSVTTTYKHHASIELAEKVIDDEDRLLNTLAHEFCHLANFMISNVKDQAHGKSFKQWAAKVSNSFAHKNIEVTTKHSYQIDYKYVWSCVDCGLPYKRHSKSIDTSRQRCGVCKGTLSQIKPVPRANAQQSPLKFAASTNSWDVYRKKWYNVLKVENPGWKMAEIMSELGKRYRVEQSSGGLQVERDSIVIAEKVNHICVVSDDEIGTGSDDVDVLIVLPKA